MARLLASPWSRRTAAAAAYVAFWGALVAAPVHRPAVNALRPAAVHRTGVAEWSADVAHRVYAEVDRRSGALRRADRTGVARAILEEATRAAMDPLLVLAVIHVESRFDPSATSGVGAVGLMQLLRPTMREEAARSRLPSADPLDPIANVRAGVRYLQRMVAAFQDVELALMAYNAGPNRIRRHLREGAVPQRLRSYPESVTRERERLAAAGEGPRVDARLCVAHARAVAARAADALAAGALPPESPRAARPPAVVALAAVTRARSRGAGSSAPPPRSRS
jgi:soluble lytic murein transglycosylase-like protein